MPMYMTSCETSLESSTTPVWKGEETGILGKSIIYLLRFYYVKRAVCCGHQDEDELQGKLY